MWHYLLTLGIVAHTYFWGAGIAALALPRRWRRKWWIFAPVFGLALQSATVWFGAKSGFSGTDDYARFSLVIPGLLLVLAAFRPGLVRRSDFQRLRAGPWMLCLAVLIVGWLLVSPLTVPGRGIYPASLGSCDAADYAAGARVLQEFAADDRVGFLDQPEVTTVRSSEYFFDVWVRLNHFTPAAFIAHHASVFGVEAYRVTALASASLVMMALPLVWLLARVTLGLRGFAPVGVALLYGISPVNAYAVHHVALGQLFAAQGIAFLTFAVLDAYRATRSGRTRWQHLGVFVTAFWLLAGSYNFILLVCLAPAVGWILWMAARDRDGAALVAVTSVAAAALWLCVFLFWDRFDGLVERFSLFAQYDFGWAVPLLSPEGWLGLVRNVGLEPLPSGLRFLLGLLVAAAWVGGVFSLRRRHARVGVALAFVIPAACGWALLAREATHRANASYDAYKLISVFLPCLIVGLTSWLAVSRRQMKPLATVFLAGLIAVNFAVALQFRRTMSDPPLRLDRSITQLAMLEKEARVASLNLLVDDFWARLWANAMLLRKPQYFAAHTYEGRLNTELRGEWDLRDSILQARPAAADDFIEINARFHASRRSTDDRFEIGFGTGWHQLEGRSLDRWRWAGEGDAAVLELRNPGSEPIEIEIVLNLLSVDEREVTATYEGREVGRWKIRPERKGVSTAIFAIPPGGSELRLTSAAPAVRLGGDTRALSFALYGAQARALPRGSGQPATSDDN